MANEKDSSVNDDEINVGDILKNISRWVHRRYATMRLLIVILLSFTLIGTVIQFFLIPLKMSYSTVVSFSFPQSAIGRYPNGSLFNINNIVNRNVLEDVWKSNELSSEKISLETFIKSVNITHYADNEKFIRSKYDSVLARKGLSQAEISSLETEYLRELAASLQGQALLSLIVPFDSSLSGPKAGKLLSDILKTWSYQAINSEGVTNIPNVDIETINQSFVQRSTPFKVVDYLYKIIENLKSTVKKIQSFPGGDSLKDPETGRSLQDVNRSIIEIERFWVIDLDSYVRDELPSNILDFKTAQERLVSLEIKRSAFLNESEVYRRSLVDYDAMRQQDQISLSGDANKSNSSGFQLQGDSIQRLINLGSENKDAEFRQNLTQQRVRAELNAVAMEEEISRLNRRMQTIVKPISVDMIAASDSKFKIETQEIVGQLQSVSLILLRIETAQMNKFMNNSGLLFTNSSIVSWPASSLVRYFGLPIGLTICLFVVFVLVSVFNTYGRKITEFERSSNVIN